MGFWSIGVGGFMELFNGFCGIRVEIIVDAGNGDVDNNVGFLINSLFNLFWLFGVFLID